MLTLFALLLPVFLAFVMLTLDVGLMTMDKSRLHRSADAAALAAVQELGVGDTPEESMDNARQVAMQYIGQNTAIGGQPLEVDSNVDIVFGQTRISQAESGVEFVPDAYPPNAIQVSVHHTVQHTSFAKYFGNQSTYLTAKAVASKKARDYFMVIDLSCATPPPPPLLDTFRKTFLQKINQKRGEGNGKDNYSETKESIKIILEL